MTLEQLHRSLRLLYTGRSKAAVRFRYGLICFDAVTILYFIVTAPLDPTMSLIAVNIVVGILISFDFAARLWVAENRAKLLRQVYVLADIVVIISLFILPFFAQEVAFLRILRGLRLIHSYHLLRDLRRDSKFFRRYESAVFALINLFVFIFVTTSLVFVIFFEQESGFSAYVDALYFTIATLTTTGFGDITPTTQVGKLLSVFIMVVGVALFVQLARAIFQPSKVKHRCSNCALSRHDQDAIHCKHCGKQLKIKTTGA